MSVLKRMYSPVAFDGLFLIAGALGLGGIALSAGDAIPAIEAAADPWMKAGALIAAMLAATLFITQTTRIDQKYADDFVFASLTKSAFMALLSFVVGAAFWESLFAGRMGAVGFHTTIGIIALLWATTWFWVRWQGTRA